MEPQNWTCSNKAGGITPSDFKKKILSLHKRFPVENSPLHIINVCYTLTSCRPGDMNFSWTFSSTAADDLNEFKLTRFSFSSLTSGQVRTQLRAATPPSKSPIHTLSIWAQPSSSIILKPSLSPQTVSHHRALTHALTETALCFQNNRLVPNRKRSTSRLYIVTLLI